MDLLILAITLGISEALPFIEVKANGILHFILLKAANAFQILAGIIRRSSGTESQLATGRTIISIRTPEISATHLSTGSVLHGERRGSDDSDRLPIEREGLARSLSPMARN